LSHSGASVNPYLYTGQQFDAASGLYYLRARYYDPALGRFLSRDPAEPLRTLPRALNRYVYVADNPLNAADPSGRQAFTEYSLITEEDEESAADFYVIGAISLGLLPEGDFALFAAGVPLGMRIALLVVTLASVAGPAIAPEAYLSPQSQTPSTSPIPEATPSENIPSVLYHYSNEAGIAGIIASQYIRPSLSDDENAAFGHGQYFTDISPAEAAVGSAYQLSRAIMNTPWRYYRVTHYVAIDVSGLPVEKVSPVFSRTYGDKYRFIGNCRG